MKQFEFTYSETDIYRAWISADSFEDAEEQLKAAQRGDLDITEITNNSAVGRDYELQIELSTLEEVK